MCWMGLHLSIVEDGGLAWDLLQGDDSQTSDGGG